jgi:hypothetical protein
VGRVFFRGDRLGIPKTAVWKDALDRPHQVYLGMPIEALT